jgi:sulfur carrier protein
VKVVLRNPVREIAIAGGRRVKDVLAELSIVPESVLVIRGDELVTADQVVHDGDVIELRPVMSGGASRAVAEPRSGEHHEASGEMIERGARP